MNKLELLASQMRESPHFTYVSLNKRFRWIRFTSKNRPLNLKRRYELYEWPNVGLVLYNKTDGRILKEFGNEVTLSKILETIGF